MKENYKIYMHKNKVNGKVYIGQTKQNPSRRWRDNGSGYIESPLFWNAIQKYGWENFEHIILEDCIETQKDANAKEKYYISLYRSNDRNYGYNILDGGDVSPRRTVCVYKYSIAGNFICSYPSILEAAESLGGNIETKTTKIRMCLYGQLKTYMGFIWSLFCVEKIDPFEKTKEVYQYTTHMEFIAVFPSAKIASVKTGISQSNIQNVCGGHRKSAGGYVFAYHPLTKDDEIRYVKNSYRKIYLYTNDLQFVNVFDNGSEVAKYLGVTRSSVSKCCTGVIKSVAGHIVSYTPIHEDVLVA